MASGAPLALIETDVLVAAIDPEDPRREEAGGILTAARRCSLSPYALIELDLLMRSGSIEVEDYHAFWRKLHEVLEHYGVTLLTPSPLHHAEAGRLREAHGLTYFDSLHAAAAIIEEATLVSYDERTYGRVGELRYVHPSRLLQAKR